MRNLKQLLSPDDRDIINSNTEVSWVPKKPREVLLPYIPESTDVEESELDQRLKIAQEVLSGYQDIITECKELESTIENRCKNISVSLNKQQNLYAMQAMARIFGQGLQEIITFDHYKACIKALADLNNQIPKPEDKE